MSAFDKIIGYQSLKKELMQISDTLKNTEAYGKLGVSAPRGLLLHGEPGVGKSLMAGAIIEDSGLKTFTCRKDQPDGDFVKQIKATFEKAVEAAPAIVYLDDMDKFANGDERFPDNEEYVTIQSCIDEVRGKQVFVLATANSIRCLPNSLRRMGRFDRVIRVSAPTGKDAEEIIKYYLSTKKFVDAVDSKTIAHLLNGRSCAELEAVINEAGLIAGYQRADVITMEHFMEACLKTVFNISAGICDDDDDIPFYKNDGLSSDSMISQVICHEAGHAVISEVLCPSSVTLIFARGDGENHEGFTHYYNDNSKSASYWIKSRVIGALAGMAAVEQVFGVKDMGITKDLDFAFNNVRDLFCDRCYGGFSFYNYRQRNSDDLLAETEKAVATKVEEFYLKAKEIISLNREFFDGICMALAEKAILSMLDVQEIKSKCKITTVAI